MKKVLIVDDEESILGLLTVVVGSIPDYTIIRARDGQEAIDTAKIEKPDIILLDNRLPRMSGLDACRLIKSDPNLPGIKIIMLSCQGQNFDWEKAREFGADAYLTKPFDVQVLTDKLEELAQQN